MREQFEKLPEVAASLSQHIYFGDDNSYHSDLINFQKLVCWLNGAWYSYQEQQKKIDQLVGVINAGLKIEQSMSDQVQSLKEKINTAIEYLDSVEGLVWYEQMKELLK